MKTFAKIAFLFLSLSAAIFTNAQVCTPMSNFPGGQGTYPLELDRATYDEPYSMIIHYKAPTDTTGTVAGQTLNVTVDSLRITDIQGLPTGFTYECHNGDCKVMGGGVGCAKITGTPTAAQIGEYPLVVMVRVKGHTELFGVPVQIPESLQTNTNERYTLIIGYHTGLNALQASSPILIYPNPAKDEVYIQLGSARKEDGIIYVKDLQGKIVLTQKLSTREATLKVSELPKGLYLLEIQALQGNYRKRLLVE